MSTADFLESETELSELCSPQVLAIYMFFDMFSVKISEPCEVNFGESYSDEVSKELAQTIKSYVKERKKEIRANPTQYSESKGRRHVFWLISMIMKHGIFVGAQGKIMTYGTYVFQQSLE
jgi:hypothetical protein